MRRSLLAVVLFALALPATPAAPVPKHLMPKEEPLFYPTRVGDRHTSVLEGRTIVWVVTKVEKTADGVLVHTEVERDGKQVPNEVVLVSAAGIKLVERTGAPLATANWWLKLPHAENNTWTNPSLTAAQKWKTVGWEEVEVPAGKFRAMRVDRIDEMGKTGTTYWYALGMGCIKWASKDRARELKSFTPGK